MYIRLTQTCKWFIGLIVDVLFMLSDSLDYIISILEHISESNILNIKYNDKDDKNL